MGLKANITLKVPVDVTRSAVGFLQRILRPVAEATDFLSDKIRYYRFRSAIRTLERAQEITVQSGITPKELPLKFLVPFLEECSLEEDGAASVLMLPWSVASAPPKLSPGNTESGLQERSHA